MPQRQKHRVRVKNQFNDMRLWPPAPTALESPVSPKSNLRFHFWLSSPVQRRRIDFSVAHSSFGRVCTRCRLYVIYGKQPVFVCCFFVRQLARAIQFYFFINSERTNRPFPTRKKEREKSFCIEIQGRTLP